jgi:hypothetical protein
LLLIFIENKINKNIKNGRENQILNSDCNSSKNIKKNSNLFISLII